MTIHLFAAADAAATAEPPWSLIAPDNVWALWAVIIAGVALSIWLEQTYKWAAKVSGPLLALGIAMILSNARIMPSVENPTYDAVWTYLIPLAVPLLLMKANVVLIVRESGWTFVAFHICALGTLLGALLAGVLFTAESGLFHVANPAEAAGIMTGSYIGGGVNFYAIAAHFEMSPNVTGPLLVADNFIMAGAFAAIFAMAGSKLFKRWYPHPHSKDADVAGAKDLAAQHWKRKEIGLLDIAKCLAIAFAVAAVCAMLSKLIQGKPIQGPPPVLPQGVKAQQPSFLQSMAGNLYVLLTFFSVLIATLFHRQVARIHGSQELGTYVLYIFLFVIGLPADLFVVLSKAPSMFLFCLVIAGTNIIVALVLGKLCRQNLEDILIGVNATLGGPPTAMTMAMAFGWSRLVLPALLVGIWGYIIGTGLGIGMTHFLRSLP